MLKENLEAGKSQETFAVVVKQNYRNNLQFVFSNIQSFCG